jgi:hypothetical protein
LLPFAEGEPVSVASIETTLELWASSLRDVKARIRPLFTQDRVAASAGQFLDGLLGPERRKTGWMRAEAAGDPGPWRQQAVLGRGRWEANALRDVVREYALETLADPGAVLVIDETGFLKQGKASCGVGRQYTGSAGSTPARRARSRVARSGCSRPLPRGTGTPSSTGPSTCPRPGLRKGREHPFAAASPPAASSRCTDRAQRTAATAPGNSASTPSPVPFTMRPPWPVTRGSRTLARQAISRR